MDHSDIQGRLDALELSMRGRTKTKRVEFQLAAHSEATIYLRHNPTFSDDWSDEKWKYLTIGRDEIVGVDGLFAAAAEFVAAMPTKEESERAAFLEKLGSVIEFGNKIGIEVEHINPLVELSKALSENALTHQPAA